MFDGRWNRYLGWAMLVTGFAGAVWLDPWSLSERDPAVLVGSPQMALRHAQAVVVGMAFLQLMVAQILTLEIFSRRTQVAASCLSGLGALVYILGYPLYVVWPASAWLMVAGALLNFTAFAVLAQASPVWPGGGVVRMVLAMFCFGMFIDVLMGLFAANPQVFLPEYIGREDGVRLRMLRLARAASIALPLVLFLYQGRAVRQPTQRVVRWGGIALVIGVIGMPLILTAAALTAVDFKFLLGLPAQATLLGTLIGVWLAYREARSLELWGWLLIALSMTAGLLMGLYAFEGPFPPPTFQGAYNNFPRRLVRLAHAYSIILGLLSIFLARELDRGYAATWPRRLGVAFLLGGAAATILAIVLLASMDLPIMVLCLGPAAVAGGLVLALPAPGESLLSNRGPVPPASQG
jgi:hypothetical protein